MAAIYAKLILRGEKTIDDVPAAIREQVLFILEGESGEEPESKLNFQK